MRREPVPVDIVKDIISKYTEGEIEISKHYLDVYNL